MNSALDLLLLKMKRRHTGDGKGLCSRGQRAGFSEAFQMVKILDPQDVRSSYEFVMRQVNDELARARAHSGLTCFSSHSINQRMWGIYGDNHAGALIQFSTERARSHFASHLSPVIYTATKLPSALRISSPSRCRWTNS